MTKCMCVIVKRFFAYSSNGTRLNTVTPSLRNTTWVDNGLNCAGSEVCLTSCLSSIPTSPLSQCSNEVGVRCSKYTLSSVANAHVYIIIKHFLHEH